MTAIKFKYSETYHVRFKFFILIEDNTYWQITNILIFTFKRFNKDSTPLEQHQFSVNTQSDNWKYRMMNIYFWWIFIGVSFYLEMTACEQKKKKNNSNLIDIGLQQLKWKKPIWDDLYHEISSNNCPGDTETLHNTVCGTRRKMTIRLYEKRKVTKRVPPPHNTWLFKK